MSKSIDLLKASLGSQVRVQLIQKMGPSKGKQQIAIGKLEAVTDTFLQINGRQYPLNVWMIGKVSVNFS